MKPKRLPLSLCFFTVLTLLLIIAVPPIFADTTVGGTISLDTTWTAAGSPYIVTSNILIRGTDGADGVTTLTIEPGVVVKFNSSRYIEVGWPSGYAGALSAIGTAANPITFTSSATSPAPGDWRGIYFYNTIDDAITVMEHCVFEYGGYNYGPIYLSEASPTFRNVAVQYSKNNGIYITSSQPIIENCTFSGNQNYDLYYTGAIGGSVTGSTFNSGIYLLATGAVNFSGNTINQNNAFPIKAYADHVGAISTSTFNNVDAGSYLEVNGGNITKDATWKAVIPYVLIDNLIVQGTDGTDGITTLTIESGATVKFNPFRFMSVGATSGSPGALVAQGTAEQPITITSNAPNPAAGDWYGIRFYATSDDATTMLEHCSVKYAGYGNYGALYIYNDSPTIRDCSFQNNSYYDLNYAGVAVGGTVANCTITNGISLLAASSVNFTANTFVYNNSFPIKTYADNVGAIVGDSSFSNVDAASYLEVSSGNITKDATWTNDIAYRIVSSASVIGTDGGDGVTTLTLEPGAVLRFNKNTYLNIGANSGDPGALAARGTLDEPILFTSNEAAPAPGDWYGIRFYNTADDANSAMEYCTVEYSGAGSYGAVFLYDAKPSVRNCTIRNNPYKGLYIFGAGSSNADIQCNTFQNNAYGLYIAYNAIPLIQYNNFSGNTTYGLYSEIQATLAAENNWWNDAQGPNTGGDSMYGNVDADPWSTAVNQCVGSGANNPPNTPIEPSPADNAVRVAINGGSTLAWSGGDPDPLDTVTYELFLGSSPDSLSMYAQNIEGCQYQVEGLSPGVTYYWKVNSTDNAGLVTPGPVWQFTTAGDPPDLIVSSLAITPSGNLQVGQTATLSATIQNAGAGPAVDAFTIDFKINGVSIGTVQVDPILYGGNTIAVNANWTYSGADPSIDVFADGAGQVQESDESNNHYVALLSAIADMTPPALTFLSPSDGAYLQLIDQISFSLNDSQSAVDEAAVLTSLAVTGNGGNVSGTKSINNGLFAFVPQTLPLADGEYGISLTAVDTYGNAQNMSFHFTIDTHPPNKAVITGDTIASGTIQARPAQNSADQFVVNLTGTRDPDTSVWINGAKVTPTGDSPWSSQLTLMPGDNAYEIWLVDRAGNQGLSEWVDISILAGNAQTFKYNQAGRLSQVTGE